MFNRQLKVLLLLTVLVASTTLSAAEPGGNGDGLRDMQCGGACHGDAGQNASSALTLSLQYSEHVWVGQPTEVTIIIGGVDVNHDENLVGLFLLSSTNANADTPLTDGWDILSDGHGGTGNYVERTTDGSGASLEHTWVLRPDSIGMRSLYASVHHGDAAGSNEGRPFFGVSEAFEIEIEAVPEDLPRLHEDFTPQSMRAVGDETQIDLHTKFTDAVTVEWRAEDGAVMEAVVNSSSQDHWEFILPAALSPSVMQWRAVLSGEGPEQTTPWFSIGAQTPAIEVENGPIYLQGLAMGLLLFGAVVALQRPRAHEEESLKKYDQTAEFSVTLAEAPATESPTQVAPLPEGGLPPGWTAEQWEWYGHEYLAGTYGDGDS